MSNILIHPKELRQTSDQLHTSAQKIGTALQAIDQDILSLKGDKFLGHRADAVQAHYAPKREALLKARAIVLEFAKDLLEAAKRFEQADKATSGGAQAGSTIPPGSPNPSNSNGNKLPKVADIALNQWDKRWANIKMNNSTGEKLANYGCLETVTAMIARAYGKDVTPVDVDKWIETHGGYPKNGSYMPAGSQAGFLNDVLGRNGSMSFIENNSNIDQYLEKGKPVILHIDSSINPKDGHYVLAVGVDSKGNYICADPNGGKQTTVSSKIIRDARVYN